MIRNKWIINFRNKLANLAMECDSVAAIEDSKLSEYERYKIQKNLADLVEYIDGHLPKPNK